MGQWIKYEGWVYHEPADPAKVVDWQGVSDGIRQAALTSCPEFIQTKDTALYVEDK